MSIQLLLKLFGELKLCLEEGISQVCFCSQFIHEDYMNGVE